MRDRDDIHSERRKHGCDPLPDLAVAYYDGSLLPKFRQGLLPVTELGRSDPIAFLDRCIVYPDLVCELEDMSYSHLGSRICAVLGDVGNHYSPFPCAFQINHIVSRRKNAYILEFGKAFDHGAVKDRLVGDTDLRVTRAFV